MAARRPTAQTALSFAAVAAPLLAGLATLLWSSEPPALNGDLALMEIAAREAARGERLLGPWGRFGWNHPGPAVFYLLALPSAVLAETTPRLHVAATLVNLAAALGTVEALRRSAGPRGALAAGVALLAFFVAVGPGYLQHPWNPTVIVLPAVAFVVLCALPIGGVATLLLGAIVGSFLVQTHVATAPLVGTALLAGLIGRLHARRVVPLRPARHPAVAVALGLLLTLVWAPVVALEAHPGPGNVAALTQFFLTTAPSRGWSDGALALGAAAATVPLGPPRAGPFRLAPLAAVPIAALVGAAVWAWTARARHPSAAADALLLGGAAGLVVCGVASTRVVGPLHGYLVTWMAAVPAVLWMGVALRVSGHGSARRVLAGAAAVLAAVAVVQAARADVPGADHDPQVAAVVRAVGRYAEAADVEAILLRQATYGDGEWRTVAGVAAALDRAGYRVMVTAPWVPRYGERFRAVRPSDLEVVFGRVGAVPRPGRLRATTPVLTVGDLYLRIRH